ncbi:hypothetical protein ACHAPU_001991 [Fusarium lateritium]
MSPCSEENQSDKGNNGTPNEPKTSHQDNPTQDNIIRDVNTQDDNIQSDPIQNNTQNNTTKDDPAQNNVPVNYAAQNVIPGSVGSRYNGSLRRLETATVYPTFLCHSFAVRNETGWGPITNFFASVPGKSNTYVARFNSLNCFDDLWDLLSTGAVTMTPEIHWHIEPDEPRINKNVPPRDRSINIIAYTNSTNSDIFTRASSFRDALGEEGARSMLIEASEPP